MKIKHLILLLISLIFINEKIIAQTYSIDGNNGQTKNVCSGTFGSSDNCYYSSEYCNNEDYSVTFCSSTAGAQIKLVFEDGFKSEAGFDFLYVMDGSSVSSPTIATLSGSISYTYVTSTTGCLTLRFKSDASTTYSGWHNAYLACSPSSCATSTASPVASDECGASPTICDLNGYCGNTSKWYTHSIPAGSNLSEDGYSGPFCGSIENNSWLQFTASSTSASFSITSKNCSDNTRGIQAGVFTSANCVTFSNASNCVSQSSGPGTMILNTNVTLTPGNSYYIMIDGYAGNVCDYEVKAGSGVQVLALTPSSASICINQSVTIAAPTGAVGYTFNPTPTSVANNVATYASLAASQTITCTVAGYCGVTSTITTLITVKPTPTLTAVSSQTICSGQASSTINFLSSPVGSTYSWANSQTSIGIAATGSGNIASYTAPFVSNTTTGIITVTPTLLGCVGVPGSFSVTINPTPTPTIIVSPSSIVCSGTTLSFTANTNGASNSYTWSSSAGGNLASNSGSIVSATPTGLGNVTYSVNVSSPLGCLANGTQIITVNATPTVNIAGTNTICSAGTGATLTANATLTGATATFSNTNDFAIPDNNSTGITSPITVSGVSGTAGTALARVCLNIKHTWDADLDITLICPGGTAIDLSSDNGSSGDDYTNTCFALTGTTVITAGSAPFTGTFTPEQSLSLLSSCSANGTWSLTVKDDGSGDVGTLLDWSLVFNNTASYSWSPSTGLSSTTSSVVVANPSVTTVYSVTVNDFSGCSKTSSNYTVHVNPTPTIAVSSLPTNSLCLGSSITHTASGANTYSWTTGATGGLATPTGSVVNATPTATGNITYTINATSVAGCTSTATKSITVNGIPSATASVSNTLTCLTQTISLLGSGGGTYSWSGPGITSGAATATPSVNLPGTYSLVVSSAEGCPSITKTITVTQNTVVPVVAAASSGTLNCSALTVNASATTTTSSTYSWSGTGITSAANISTITVNQPGTFNYTVTNSSTGCFTTGSQAIIQNTVAPTLTVSSTQTITCAAPTVTMTGAASPSTCTPVWTGGVSSGGTTYSATAASSGNYTLTVTDPENFCTTAKTVSVSPSPGFPSLTNPIVTGSITCSTATVQVVMTATNTNVTYNWLGAGIIGATNTPTIIANVGGTYSLAVTNTIASCTSSITAFVPTNTTSPTVSGTSTGSLNCTISTVSVSATTSATPVSYNWSGPGIVTTNTITPITVNAGGTYNYTVTNTINNCVTINSVTVVQNTISPTVTGANTGSLNCTVLSVDASATTTTTPVSYSWSGPGITSTNTITPITVNAGGTYVYVVTDIFNNCATTNSVNIVQNTVYPIVASSNTGSLNCTVSSVNASATTTTTPVSYNWTGAGITNGATTGTISVNIGGTYDYTVTNTFNNCATSNSIAIIQSTISPSVVGANTGSLNCTVSNVDVSATTTTTPVSYNWTGSGITAGTGTGTISVNAGGTFNYTVTNTFNKCAITNSVTVIKNTDLPVVVSANTGSLNCTTTSIDVSATTTTSPVSFDWTGPGIVSGLTTGTVSVSAGGAYNYTVTNKDNDCSVSGFQTIVQSTVSPTFTLGTTPTVTTTCALPNATLSATSSDDPNTVYEWLTPTSNTLTGSPIVTSSTGIYTLVITNTTNNCATSATGPTTIEVVADTGIPTVTLSVNTLSITCYNPTPTVTISTTATPVSYSWTPTSGIVPGTETTASPVFNAAGSYSVIVNNTISGCATSINANTITVVLDNTVPVIDPFLGGINSATINCLYTSVTATAVITPSANTTYTWSSSTGNGIASPVNQATATFTAADVYTLTVTNTSNGCVTSNTNTANTFTVYETINSPTISLVSVTSNTFIGCTTSNSVVSYSVNVTSTGPVNYLWQPSGATTPIIDLTGAGNYTVYVMDQITNCVDSVEFSVATNTVAPQAPSAGSNGVLICGAPTTSLSGTSTSTNVTYNWSGPSSTSIMSGSNTATPIVSEVGTYTLTIIDNTTGCSATSTVNITQGTVNASFTADTLKGIVPTTINFTNQSTGTNTFNWDFGNGSTSTIQNPNNVYNTAGSFIVTLIVTEGSCVDTASVTIVIEEGLTLEIPNVFTPNGDGRNDIFSIKSTGVKEIFLIILNRWGTKMYEFSGPNAAWDGTTNAGEDVSTGTYFYILKATGYDDKVIEKQGALNLFR